MLLQKSWMVGTLLAILCACSGAATRSQTVSEAGNREIAASNPGAPLVLRKSNDGKLAFGVHFTLARDPGSFLGSMTFLLTYATQIQPAELEKLPAQLRWNFYNESEGRYLVDWDASHTIEKRQLVVNQMKLEDVFLLKRVMPAYSNLLLVFADENNKPLLFLDMGKICRESPEYFHNLTNEKKCSEITDRDVRLPHSEGHG